MLLLVVIIGLALLSAYSQLSASRKASGKPGDEAPAFRLTALDGARYAFAPGLGARRENGSDGEGKRRAVNAAERLDQRPVVLHFWASWCEPCHEEAPQLAELYGIYNGDVDIFGVNLTAKDDLEAVRRFAALYALPYPVLLDERSEAADAYRVAALPVTYFIDRDGTVAGRIVGLAAPEAMEEQYRRLLR